MKVIQNISNLDDNALSRLFANAQRLLSRGKNMEDAQMVIEAITEEWEKRLQLFLSGRYKAASPQNGVLSMVGYKVGNDGEKTVIRRQMLDYIMSETLPPVSSPAHMAEWGKKLTKTRYRKLHRVIRVLASSGKTMGNMDKAVSEWEDDLEYLEKTWASKFY